MKATKKQLVHLIECYADHQSWRCSHAQYWKGESCACGLTDKLAALGLHPDWMLITQDTHKGPHAV